MTATIYCPECHWTGPDNMPDRVCECCGADEPAEDTGRCHACGRNTWWLPKCPACGSGCVLEPGEESE